jgi:hypothetical protein
MKAEPHRHRVLSHVQGRRHKRWKREEETKDLRRSARRPSQDELHSRSLSPTIILAGGHSDPFGALPVKIGPKENELISFYRDVMIPAQYDLPFQVPNLSALREADWADCKGSLQNEGVAHALLAWFGQAVSNCTTASQVVTMAHQHQSTKLLLGKSKPGSELQDFGTYLHINMLFSAETLRRNLEGALAHGKVLRHMFEEARKQGSLNYKLLLFQLYNDCQVSSMFLVRPIWDVRTGCPWYLHLYGPLRLLTFLPPTITSSSSTLRQKESLPRALGQIVNSGLSRPDPGIQDRPQQRILLLWAGFFHGAAFPTVVLWIIRWILLNPCNPLH